MSDRVPFLANGFGEQNRSYARKLIFNVFVTASVVLLCALWVWSLFKAAADEKIRTARLKGIFECLRNGTHIALEDIDYLEATIRYYEMAYRDYLRCLEKCGSSL